VGPAERAAAGVHSAALARLGFQIDDFGTGAVLVHAVPPDAAHDDPALLARAVLDELAADRASEAIEARIARVVCKRASVKGGQPLGADEMRALLTGLEHAREPLTCPHGRPTLLVLDAKRLAREFGRT
jgi:DNA mismatch repair protein MutL